MDTLKQLTIKRTAIKSSITKFGNYIENIDISTEYTTQLKIRQNKISNSLDQLTDVQIQICNIDDSEDIEQSMDSIEDRFYDYMAKAQNLLNRKEILQECPKLESRINLKTFKSLVHENNHLTSVQKFIYLKSCLHKQAATIIQSLDLTAENYEVAWKSLIARYNNKKLVIQKHIKAINDLPVLTKENGPILRQIVDGVLKHCRALQALNRPTDQWDDLLIYIITNKLDHMTSKEWESSTSVDTIPTFQELIEFLSRKCNTLDAINKHTPINCHKFSTSKNIMSHTATQKFLCQICKENHIIYYCPTFLKMQPDQRLQRVKALKLCFNCLKSNHGTSQCNASSCKKCQNKHNTLLHISKENQISNSPSTSSDDVSSIISANCSQINPAQVLLSTAIINVKDNDGKYIKRRALLDSGSQSSFISETFAQKLKLQGKTTSVSVVGVNQTTSIVNKIVELQIKSICNNFSTTLNCFILPTITQSLPIVSLQKSKWSIPKNLKLADPDFNIKRPVDLLIGAELFWQLLCVGQIKLNNSGLFLRKTHLGWIASGKISNSPRFRSVINCNATVGNNLDILLTKFWQLEQCTNTSPLTLEERKCETHFVNTYKRDETGRFVVKLPFRDNMQQILGDSKSTALKRFYNLERKLNKEHILKAQYSQFLEEYEALGHMRLVENPSDKGSSIYLPHHAVIKSDSSTTKLRVVFDGSARTSSGISLNEALMAGPTVQQDLFSIICRFRIHTIVITADIEKMYRQINIHEDDGFYVDDLLTGAPTVDTAKKLVGEIDLILSKGGFPARKWASNVTEVLEGVRNNASTDLLVLDAGSTVKTLGLQWNSTTDKLGYKTTPLILNGQTTKRSILSNIAKLFDPLGLVGPIIVNAKLLMQRLWQLGLHWDESVPIDIHTTWCAYEQDVQDLQQLQVQRCVTLTDAYDYAELHGFCDASESAYGACVYLRTVSHNKTASHLLCSKSRVAPLRNTTLPRLELCGAVLLASLMSKIKAILTITTTKTYYWTDSMIVLAWLRSTSKTWKTFVANRVSEIQELTDIDDWYHVPSEQNSADLLSRGTTSAELIHTKLWWYGPLWLSSSERLPITSIEKPSMGKVPEARHVHVNLSVTTSGTFHVFSKYSNIQRLHRVIAYCIRFINNTRTRARAAGGELLFGPLSRTEVKNASIRLILNIQRTCFTRELTDLQNQRSLHNSSRLLCLNPFLDEHNLIRVGGRLQNSKLPFSTRFPILLPSNHAYVHQLVRETHERHLHSGTNGTLAAIREKYWPLSAKNTIKGVIRRCIVCFKSNPSGYQYIMGNLPKSRVEESRPFINSGVDYAGPLMIRESRRRGSKQQKVYVTIFVCLSTKAVNIELVADLSTDSFLSALKRMVSRRGKIANVYSDNATNFVGANRELERFSKLLRTESNAQLNNFLLNEQISWHFIPPRSPHFGGIWEAAVKSMKYHLRRIVGNAALTYEELYTVLTQIEAVLNSRPIHPTSNDPNDLTYLTPGHFLIGMPLTAPIEPSLEHLNINRLSRYQLIERIKQHFWSRWTKEYLQTLQVRSKWKSGNKDQLLPNDLVMIKEEGLPPLQWSIGRVVAVHPGNDNVVRCATIKTTKGTFTRASSRLCVLPVKSV